LIDEHPILEIEDRESELLEHFRRKKRQILSTLYQSRV
jgi:hypothetical protein